MVPWRPATVHVRVKCQSNSSPSPRVGVQANSPISVSPHSSKTTPAVAASCCAVGDKDSVASSGMPWYQSAPHMMSWSFHHLVTSFPPLTGMPCHVCSACAHVCCPIFDSMSHARGASTPNASNSAAAKAVALSAMVRPGTSMAGPKARCGSPVASLMMQRQLAWSAAHEFQPEASRKRRCSSGCGSSVKGSMRTSRGSMATLMS